MSIRILLADNHAMVRKGIRAVLEAESDLTVVAEASTGLEAVELTRRHRPDVVVLDVAMPELTGIEATRTIVQEMQPVKVLALSTHSESRYVHGMLEAGAMGYVLTTCEANELMHGIRSVASGSAYLCPCVTPVVLERYAPRGMESEAGPAHAVLTSREVQVLQLIAEGRTSKETAHRLCLSVRTIDAHRQRIMEKLKLHSVADLTRYAIKEGLTPLNI